MTEKQNIWLRAIGALFLHSRIALVGASITTAAAIGGIALMIMGTLFRVDSPYIGILAFLVFPAIFVFGLVLIPIGNVWARIRRSRAKHEKVGYPKLDFGDPRVRREFGIVAFLTAVNLFIISTATFQGVAYMETEQFCGQVCHTVMEPEFTAHGVSAHANVSCVACHIGPGAESFVKAKLNGVNQLIGVMVNDYPTPIPTPVHNLRHAQEICAECHDPDQYLEDQVRVFAEYGEDEANTPLHSVLVMRMGPSEIGPGIHGSHNDPDQKIYFYASDEQRQDIQYVRVEHADGTTVEYTESGAELPANATSAEMLREMDCTDCHNRPAHTFEMPQRALDVALAHGEIDPAIPSIKAAGLEALTETAEADGSAEDAAAHLRAFYAENHTDYANANADALNNAVNSVEAIYARNVFPQMKVTWGTYPDNSGHMVFEGCFRCHDGSLENPAGEVISDDCTVCHEVLAFQEEAPDILSELNMSAPN